MPQVDTPTASALLERMLLIRAYEENNCALQAAGNFPGTCTSIGQEAAAVGVVAALGPDDLIITNHRSAGHRPGRQAGWSSSTKPAGCAASARKCRRSCTMATCS